jgi:hypothetical protein
MTIFWDIAPCSIIEVDGLPETSIASVIRAVALGSTHV